MKKPFNLAAVTMLLFLSSCFSCEYEDFVPVLDDLLGGWVLFKKGPDMNGNNLPDEAELHAISPDKTSLLLMQRNGNGEIRGEECNSGFQWEMKTEDLVVTNAAGNIGKSSYDAVTKQMTIQVKTDTSTIWMVFIKQQGGERFN